MKNVYINGLRIYAPSSFEEIIDFVSIEPKILVAINAEKIYHATEITRSIVNNNIGYPDGIGAVYAMRKKGLQQENRVPGCDLWLVMIEKLQSNKSFYFVGAKPAVIKQTVARLEKQFPKINILGFCDGYFKTDKEKEDLINNIVKVKPDVVFVAMGSPRQEMLMEEMYNNHTAIYQGLGGSFDLFVGVVKKTPMFLQNNGFHWLYRALQQPFRIKRHLALFKFLFNLYLTKKY